MGRGGRHLAVIVPQSIDLEYLKAQLYINENLALKLPLISGTRYLCNYLIYRRAYEDYPIGCSILCIGLWLY